MRFFSLIRSTGMWWCCNEICGVAATPGPIDKSIAAVFIGRTSHPEKKMNKTE